MDNDITQEEARLFYQALLDKNVQYEGVFFVGVTTTGVFCRPTCPARKPKYENCEFFRTSQAALLAAFRPCMRCRPLSYPGEVSEVVQALVDAVEAEPEKRWSTQDFENLAVDESTARRHFKKRFGMTFIEYARARRMGLAFKHIRSGSMVVDAQLHAGYESSSGFRDAFSKIMGVAPTRAASKPYLLKASWIDTPLGPMVAIADETHLYLLEFVERRGLEREIERLRSRLKAAIVPGKTATLISIESELKSYFLGKLKTFKTPLMLLGSAFQKSVWEGLMRIPCGQIRSYKEQAVALGKPKAYRAVANANGANQIAIAIPCHRVINSNGDLGGYGGGLIRKKRLLEHEKKYF